MSEYSCTMVILAVIAVALFVRYLLGPRKGK